jgi:hypothetical protein
MHQQRWAGDEESTKLILWLLLRGTRKLHYRIRPKESTEEGTKVVAAAAAASFVSN